MAQQNIPKPPVQSPWGSHQWMEWFRKMSVQVANPTNVAWSNIIFDNSNITSITNRAHNNLQSIQGGVSGEYYHLKESDYNFYTGLRKLSASATLNFPSIAAQSCQELTISLTGAQINDTIVVGAPETLNNGLVWSAYVSAVNTVTIRVCNVTASAIDPPSGSWKINLL